MWTNLFDMLEAIREHIRITGKPVQLDDRPLERSLGYKDGEQTWHITLTNARRAFVEAANDSQRNEAKLFCTLEGRQKLVNHVKEVKNEDQT